MSAVNDQRPLLFVGDALAAYGFPDGHPLGMDRQGAFLSAAQAQRLDTRARVLTPIAASRAQIERFHTARYVDRVIDLSRRGSGYLDYGDTPALPHMFEAASYVVGSALHAAQQIVRGEARRSFQPIGGLHHARRDAASGFCVFNDLGVLIETLRTEHGVRRIAYIDIDVHHGDGVFYEFEDDADLIVVDIHQDGNTLYPGTGFVYETGRGPARGSKLNLPLAPGANDADFLAAWTHAEAFLRTQQPEFFIMQCGADCLTGDPLANLSLSAAAHTHAARRTCALAEEFARGRLMAFGGGGYHRGNLARAWCAVLAQLIDAPSA